MYRNIYYYTNRTWCCQEQLDSFNFVVNQSHQREYKFTYGTYLEIGSSVIELPIYRVANISTSTCIDMHVRTYIEYVQLLKRLGGFLDHVECLSLWPHLQVALNQFWKGTYNRSVLRQDVLLVTFGRGKINNQFWNIFTHTITWRSGTGKSQLCYHNL